MNKRFCLVNSFVNLGRVPLIFNEQIIQEPIVGGHMISECKEDEIEDTGITNFGFMEDNTDDF